MSGRRLRVAMVASARYPIREPFAGGLEAQTWLLADGLVRRGHEVALFAAEGSDPALSTGRLLVRAPVISGAARGDVSMCAPDWLAEHHAYLGLMLDLMDSADRYDVVHNNSLHHLPVAMARALPMPVVTTLHTPPTPWLESAIQVGRCPSTFVAVSCATARAWRHVVPDVQVVRNGIDLDVWHPGPGGGELVWFGRIVPEKGPDLAVAAARRAGVPLTIYGPVPDVAFFDAQVRPLLGGAIRYGGHLSHGGLVDVVGRASGVLVTPRWEEPYGLVVAEALACGTPVIGFARGAVAEVVGERTAVLVRPDDVVGLADAIAELPGLDRGAARAHAERACGAERMVDEYEALYRFVAGDVAA